ncbi:MAG: Fur family transcriptional regulator [Campylobacterota bacterium]|nr:Fur family transcriptional regulator [Campylobacterota bacterium]
MATDFQNNEVIDQLKTVLKDKGMKYTEQRAVILEIITQINGHLNAEEIHGVVKNKYPQYNIGIATVYRTLNFLEEADLISSISFGTEGKKYEGNQKTHHDHLICTQCGLIIEFVDPLIEQQQDVIAKENKFKITGHTMQLYGLCPACDSTNKGDK